MSSSSAHLSSFSLDAMLLGALSAEELSAARQHLGGCGRCQQELEEVRASHDAFKRSVLPRTLPALRQHQEDRPIWQRPWLPILLVPALAAVLFSVVVTPGLLLRTAEAPREAELSIKGGPSFRVFARRRDSVFAVKDKTTLAPGDEIRFIVEPSGLPYVMIASVDGAGNATVYLPYRGSQSFALDAGLKGELPGSITLDAAPGPERVFALFSRQPLSAAQVNDALRAIGSEGAEAIRAAGPLQVPADAQVSIVFEKMVL